MKNTFRRSIVTVGLAAAMSLGMAAPAIAAPTNGTVNLGVTYTETGNGTAPTETITYAKSNKTVSGNTFYTNTTMPDLTIGSAEVSDTTKNANIVLTIPEYQAVGTYTYTLTRTAIDDAGVTDSVPTTITVVVTVENGDNGFNRYVNIFNGSDTSDANKKINNVNLSYAAGQLTVTKKVTGNLGDKTSGNKFNFKVTLNGPSGKTISGTYKYSVAGGAEQDVTFTDGVATITGAIADSQSIVFKDLPAGVTYDVNEMNGSGTDATAINVNGTVNGYTLKSAVFSDDSKTIASGDTDTATFTNDKTNTNIDTGVILNNAPYIAILGGAAVVAIYFANRRRNADED